MTTHRFSQQRGFALPTVIITSVTMMIVLLASLQALTSITVSIKEQYNQKLISEAVESGSIFAAHCLKAKQNATWTQLRPETNCDGASPQTCTTATSDPCSVMRAPGYRTYFQVSTPVKNGTDVQVEVTAYLDFSRTSSGTTYRTSSTSKKLGITQLRNLIHDRAIQRHWKVGDTGGSSLFDFGASGTSNPTITAQSGPSFEEGLTVVNDVKGNYLFSSDGIKVWNKNNSPMSGTLGANNSTAQGIIAFPISGKNRYLVVSNSAARDNGDNGGYGQIAAEVVDMEQNSGLGGIVSVPGVTKTFTRAELNGFEPNPANQIVRTNPNAGDKYTGEFMTAAPEASGNGYWVVFGTPGRIYFYALLFDNDGQYVKVVRSTTPSGEIPVCKYNGDYTIGVGIARFNSNYDKLAIASGTSNCQVDQGSLPVSYAVASNKDRGYIYLMSFNSTTGQLGTLYSNIASQQFAGSTICMAGGNTAAHENIAYSIDFSPGENYLYYTTLFPTDLYRYRITGNDIESGAVSVASTAQFLGHADNYRDGASYANSATYPRGGQVRRAPNNKMYVANQRSTKISVVNNPDDAMTQPSCGGLASNFSYNTVNLGGSVTSGRGLPDYVTRYVPRTIQY